MIKKLLIFYALLFAAFTLPAQDDNRLQKANESYAGGDFQAAADLYEDLLKDTGASVTIYYNLGNSYYRLNNVARSILNYERALLMEPGNSNIRFNLEIAKLKAVDRIEPLDAFFVTEWFHSLQNLMSTDAWSRFSIGCFISLIVGLLLFFFSRRLFIKKLGFFLALGLLVCVVFGNTFASNQKKKLTQRKTAIIFAPTTTIKSSPDNSGTELFILHEGTKVRIKQALGNWNEIETADGNVGWIKSSEIEVI